MQCPKCKSLIPDDSLFCQNCGSTTRKDPETSGFHPHADPFVTLGDLSGGHDGARSDRSNPPERSIKEKVYRKDLQFCTACGKPIPSDSPFCEHCGAAAQAAGKSSQASQHNQNGRPNTAAVRQRQTLPKKEGSHRSYYILAGIILFVLVVAGLSSLNDRHAPEGPASATSVSAGSTGTQKPAPTVPATVPPIPKDAPTFVYTYEKNDTGITITGFDGELPSQLDIPASIDGYRVTKIDHGAFRECSSILYVTIPDSVTELGNNIFSHCENLTSVVIPDGITAIGAYMFDGCRDLTCVGIPDSVTYIGECAFGNCPSLHSIVIPDGVTEIGISAFVNDISLRYVVIPDSVRIIQIFAFCGCESLESVTISQYCYYDSEAVFPEACQINFYH